MKETLEACKDEKDFTAVHKAIQDEIENIKNEQKQHEIEFDKKIEAANKAGDKKTANQAKRDKKNVIQGLDGYIVAENDDTLLICKLSEEQRIKNFSGNN
jgi:hypothetical protein